MINKTPFRHKNNQNLNKNKTLKISRKNKKTDATNIEINLHAYFAKYDMTALATFAKHAK